jgi:ABC-2 type transport system permease protein
MKMLHNIQQFLEDLAEVCQAEWGRIFGNTGVLLIFFVAGVGYPLIFNGIYVQENLYDVPVAVVDDARCKESKRFIHKMDATPEIEVRFEAG